MRVHFILEGTKGSYQSTFSVERPEITCNSDLAQQAPNWIIKAGDIPYIFHRLSSQYNPVFRQAKEVICV